MGKKSRRAVEKFKRKCKMKTKKRKVNGCGEKKKIKFDTYEKALIELNYCQDMGLKVKRVYKCDFCKKYHLTSRK